MAIRWTWRKAIMESSLPPSTRHILHVLDSHMTAAGENCRPSLAQIARETGLEVTSVKRGLANAEANGWIVRHQNKAENGGWLRTSYEPVWPDQNTGSEHQGGRGTEHQGGRGTVHQGGRGTVHQGVGAQCSKGRGVDAPRVGAQCTNPNEVNQKCYPDFLKSDLEKPKTEDRLNAEAWREFEEHRVRKGQPLTDIERRKNRELMVQQSKPDQQAMVDACIRGGYNGVVEPRNKKASTQEDSGRAPGLAGRMWKESEVERKADLGQVLGDLRKAL